MWLARGDKLYRLLADAVVLAHLLFIAFVVGGGLLVLRWPRLAWFHLPAALWGAMIEFMGRVCPLTPLENHLRQLAGDSSYGGDFVERYLLPIIYPENLTLATQQVLGGLVIGANLLVYMLAIRYHRTRRAKRTAVPSPSRSQGAPRA